MQSTSTANTDTQITHLFDQQKHYLTVLKRRSANERSRKLKGLAEFIKEHKLQIEEAAYKDFYKPAMEVRAMEIYPVLNEIKHIRKNINKWMQPQHVSGGLKLMGTQSKIIREPKGQVLIISPWNYPFNLSMIPLINAMAAGNSVILKPSEQSRHTSELLQYVIESVFESQEAAVVQGDEHVAQALLEKPFHHVIFTGSQKVGKQVMEKASTNLTEITLELGGKSPALIDTDADLKKAIPAIVWGKFANAGQSCIAPDYVLAPSNRRKEVVEALSQQIKKAYGNTDQIQNGKDFARIVNKRHFRRVLNLMQEALDKGATLAYGGEYVESDRFIEPTILTFVRKDAALRREEIFGPVLPVFTYESIDQAIDYINSGKRPLTVYAFTRHNDKADQFSGSIIAGSVVINEVFSSYINPNLPFGGINDSGIGELHGEFGFRTLSNEKAVHHRKRGWTFAELMQPPYRKGRQKLARFIMRYF